MCNGSPSYDGETVEETARNREIEKELQKDKKTYRSTHRLLLLGSFSLPVRCLPFMKVLLSIIFFSGKLMKISIFLKSFFCGIF